MAQRLEEHSRRLDQLDSYIKWVIVGILSTLGSAGIQLLSTLFQVKK